MIDQLRASKLPANMMQFAARGALAVPPDENIEILVYLAKYNKVFGDLARMTLAGWDEKASLAAAADPKTASVVLDYLIAPENLRPVLLPALLENPSIADHVLAKFAVSASRDAIKAMLESPRVRGSFAILDSLKSSPYLNANETSKVGELLSGGDGKAPEASSAAGSQRVESIAPASELDPETTSDGEADAREVADEDVSAYLAGHATEIAAEQGKPFQPIGGILDSSEHDSSPESTGQAGAGAAAPPIAGAPAVALQPQTASTAANPAAGVKKPLPHVEPKRENTVQKINHLDVKGRIQLAMKGNKEERSILIRDGTKVVALAVLEAPKLSDGEVEKFASQKNVLEAVLRQIPLKRRFMKNYIVVRNLVGNPRTPIDLSLGLMKNVLVQDLKNISTNKEISETIRKLALKMYKQKMDAMNKK
jgi:hypothetical protein